MARRNNRRDDAKRALLAEARRLHEMSLGRDHCDPHKLYDCVAFQQLMPQAADNLKRRAVGK